MSTLLSVPIAQARGTLLETSANFWTDAELLEHAVQGCKQLWRKIIDLHEGHFQTIDDTNVTLAASTATLTGVPADCFRVESIELRDLTSTASIQNTVFSPKKKNHPDWQSARALGSVDPTGREFYYDLRNAGSPVAAPAIDIAPMALSTVNLRLIYVHVLGTLTAASTNPIPGESDHAIYAWIVAHARAKEREKRDPDPEWLAVFATDQDQLLTALTPRQTQEPEFVEGMFEGWS